MLCSGIQLVTNPQVSCKDEYTYYMPRYTFLL